MVRIPVIHNPRPALEVILNDQLSEGRSFQCPLCRTKAIPVSIERATLLRAGAVEPAGKKHDLIRLVCAGCSEDILFVRRWHYGDNVARDDNEVTDCLTRVYPLGRAAAEHPATDDSLTTDYEAACRTLEVSPEASACMSRRCLQSMLRRQGYDQKDLATQIGALIEEANRDKVLPKILRNEVDLIRNYGNFGAHEQTDKSTLEIIPVERGEAERCIQILETLFDHYFEGPARSKARLAEANKKFGKAGKPEAKS